MASLGNDSDRKRHLKSREEGFVVEACDREKGTETTGSLVRNWTAEVAGRSQGIV